MGLRDQVQSGKVAAPTQREFDRKAWEAITSDPHSADDDRSLASTGLWFSERWQHLRDSVTFVSPGSELSPAIRRLAVVALCNRDVALLHIKHISALNSEREKSGLWMLDQALGMKLSFQGGDFNIDEMLPSLVDAIEFPLRELLRQTDVPYKQRDLQQISWDEVGLAMNIGVAYASLVSAWEEVLWHSYVLVAPPSDTAPWVLRPTAKDKIDIEAVSTYRHQSLQLNIALNISSLVRGRDPSALALAQHFPAVVSYSRAGKKKRFGIGRLDLSKPHLITTALLEELTVPDYYAPLLTQNAPSGVPFNLAHVIAAWRLLRGAVGFLWNSALQQAEEETTRGKLDDEAGTDFRRAPVHRYVQTIQRQALVDLIERGMSAPPPAAEALVEFFTFKGARANELWTQPLVSVGDGTLMPVFGTLIGPNLSRNIDKWLQQLGFDMAPRGVHFETFVRAQLSDKAVEQSGIVPMRCVTDSFVFSADGFREEIDLIVRIGDAVLLGEVKCAVQPTSPEMWHRHLQIVRGAATQVHRKLQFVEDNRDAFRARMNELGIHLPEHFFLQPLVLLNSAHNAGRPVAGIPVVDLPMIRIFLENELQQLVTVGGDGAKTAGRTLSFYAKADDVPKAASSYFLDPPQVMPFFAGLKWRLVRIYLVSSDEVRRVVHVVREVVVDIEAAKAGPRDRQRGSDQKQS